MAAAALRARNKRLLEAADGYLELGMPEHALEQLDELDETAAVRSDALHLRGEGLRRLERYQEALTPLTRAATIAPSNVEIWLALGWCYKRVDQIEQAIESLEHALQVVEAVERRREFSSEQIDAEKALIIYNLACYWSLAGDKRQSLDYLAQALEMDKQYRPMIDHERDFDPIRADPDFQDLLSRIVV